MPRECASWPVVEHAVSKSILPGVTGLFILPRWTTARGPKIMFEGYAVRRLHRQARQALVPGAVRTFIGVDPTWSTPDIEPVCGRGGPCPVMLCLDSRESLILHVCTC